MDPELSYNCSSLDNVNLSPTPGNCSYWYDLPTAYGDYNDNWTFLFCYRMFQIFHALTFVFGICGNVLVIYVISKHSQMKTVTNFYILNLAIADILFLLGLPFLIVTSVYDYWIFGHFMCKIYMVLTSLNQFTSSLFLTVMSADRYVAVCHPINSPKYRTYFISKLVSLTAWTSASVMTLPVYVYSSTLHLDGKDHCNIFWPNSSLITGQLVFVMYTFIFSFAFPLTLIFTFYTQVVMRLRNLENNSKARGIKKPKRKVVRLVFSLIVVYAICYSPYWTLQITLAFMKPRKPHTPLIMILFLFSSCLSYINSAINPVLYAFFSDNFKKSFKHAFICDCVRNVNPINNFPLQQNSMIQRHQKTSETTDNEKGEFSHI